MHPELRGLDLIHSRDAPEIGVALGALREAAGEPPLIGEVYLPVERVVPYLDSFDAVFGFDLLHAELGRRPARRRDRPLAVAPARSRG